MKKQSFILCPFSHFSSVFLFLLVVTKLILKEKDAFERVGAKEYSLVSH
jgi:hypothetical protein